MESEVIVYSFLIAGFISLIGFGFFMWMNLKDRSLDEKLYKQRKDPRILVSKYKHTGRPLENDPNPIVSLKKYAIKNNDFEASTIISKSKKSEETAERTENKENNTEQSIQADQDDTKFAPPWLKESKEEKN